MAYVLLGVGVLVAVLTTLLLTPPVRRVALRVGWVDVPDARKVHRQPIPRIGGIAMAVGASMGLAFFYCVKDYLPFQISVQVLQIWCGTLFIWLVGLYDDLRGLGFKVKFLAQLIVAYAMVGLGYCVDLSQLPLFDGWHPYHLQWIAMPLTLIWIIGVMNAVNMMDGMDGLAAGVTGIALLSLATIYGSNGDLGMLVISLVTVGAICGFLVYNSHPASIFMGDSGSLLLGFVLALYTLSGPGHLVNPYISLLVPVIVVGLPLMDTSLSILRRLANGKSPFMPDKDHMHHRINKLTKSHRDAVWVLYGVGSMLGACGILLAHGGTVRAVFVLCFCGLVLFLFLKRLGYGTLSGALHRQWVQRRVRRRAENAELKQTRAVFIENATRNQPVDTPYL